MSKVIVITGASSGIGEATARRLAAGGNRVVLGARRADRLEALARAIREAGGHVEWKATDVTRREDVEALVDWAEQNYGRVDVIVNNAGIMPLSNLDKLHVHEWDQMIDVNIKGVLYGIAAALPRMQKQASGHIINVSSIGGHQVFPTASVYCATKFAVRAISDGLRQEAGKDVRVTVISPGVTESELASTITDKASLEYMEDFRANAIPADAIAAAIEYAIHQPAQVAVSEIVVRPTGGVWLYRSRSASPLQHVMQKPALCLLLEGRKEVYLGAEVFRYDPDHYLLVSVDLPISGRVVEGPYLGISIDLDPLMSHEVSLQVGQVAPATEPGILVSPFDPMLRNAVERYLGLLARPEHLPVLGSIVQREIVYHLLHSPQAAALQRLAGLCGHTGAMRAVEWLKQNYAEPLSIEELARSLALSPSGLHHQFKALTTMSPLQYQKQVRLQEARRLLLSGDSDAATVGFQVGYNSPSQFSREYRRMFGAPPAQDASRMRAESAGVH